MIFNFFLIWWSILHHKAIGFHACLPNRQFYFNGLLCQCDGDGTWTEANCRPTFKRRICNTGHVIYKDCSKCICQENGQYLCTYEGCEEGNNMRKTEGNILLEAAGSTCTPFKSYFVNCNICFCPPSGLSEQAQCSRDDNCTSKTTATKPSSKTLLKTACVPKLIYMYPCLQCLCSDHGRFDINKCIETCNTKKRKPLLPSQCAPKSFYKNSCNVCFCPTNGISDAKYCSKKKCANDSTNIQALRQEDAERAECTPYKFTEERCFYCTCNPGSTVNENHCLEVECELIEESEYTAVCVPDEMYPICAECYCYKSNIMDISYCSKLCSQENKAAIFKRVLNDSTSNPSLLDTSELPLLSNETQCEPNALFQWFDKICLCPETGVLNDTYCSAIGVINQLPSEKPHIAKDLYEVNINFNATCTPSTFIYFNCNVCFCTKNGTIDPKWCTYDDCEILQKIENSRLEPKLEDPQSDICTPGIITKVGCNVCLCTQSGLAKDRTCSLYKCDSSQDTTNYYVDILCKPTAYYEVGCNVCLCPKDGIKNLESCSKKSCDKSELRSATCVPGKLFSDECNVCLCPPTGQTSDKICTKNDCSYEASAHKIVLAVSQKLLDKFEAYTNHSRTLDPCYPDEEFVQGCKLCVCPDMGLKQYATCTTMLCDQKENSSSIGKDRIMEAGHCSAYNVDMMPKENCIPGGIYFKDCKQCLCQENGTNVTFCRELPEEYKCKNQTHPGNPIIQHMFIKHEHSLLSCVKPGRVVDKCHVCDCESHEYNYIMVEEHCFKSDEISCENGTVKNFGIFGGPEFVV